MSKTLYSAVIIAKNEERTIAKCIKSLSQVTDDIVVVLDDRSTDLTEEICTNLGVRVISKTWEGFSKNKNYGASIAKNDWILCFDADEVIDEVIISHLRQLHAQDDTVYLMNILTYIGDKAIKFSGWHPDWNIRLYNKKIMEWNDAFVHEKLINIDRNVELEPQRINGLVHHYSFSDWGHMSSKYDYYAHMRSDEWIRRGHSPIGPKRWFGPGFRFFKTYFLRLGILDGVHGFNLARREYILRCNELKYYKEKKTKKTT